MGVGSPSKEIVHLLNHRGIFPLPFLSNPTPLTTKNNDTESFFQRISAIISFIDTSTPSPLPSVSDQNTYYLSKWYKQNSLIFLTSSHQMWNGDKKP
ncbi:MAG: hypothetical protein Q9225_004938, partial [Loekoesia sp. 1 TL-2023]